MRVLSVKRRVHNIGASWLVVLPKIWTDSRGLKPHDQVELILNDDLTVRPLKAGKADGAID